jgi:FixJ family two-component response regulator
MATAAHKPVLFIDDNRDLRELVRETLRFVGVEGSVIAASLADLKVQRDAAVACELAIIDINLGRDQPTGVEVHDWLKQEGFAGRVVFLTGHGEDDARVRAASQLGGTRLLTKPIDFSDFVRLIEETA